MARLFPPSSHPHLFLDVSHRACSECVVDCDDATCIAEVDDRCTDKCVIVPCDDPEHGDVQCPEGKCESPICDIHDNCPLPGHTLATCDTLQHTSIACAGEGCSVPCESTCDDPDNCSFAGASKRVQPRSSRTTAEHTYAPHTHSLDWDMTLDAFLCSCGVEFPSEDDTPSHTFLQDPYLEPSPALSTLASPSETNTLPAAFDTPSLHPSCTPPSYVAQAPTPMVLSGHTCLWNGCQSTFSSLDELISHVNLSHLRAFSSQVSEPVPPPSSVLPLSSDAPGFSCQWDNCHEYSLTPANSSNNLALDDALNSLAGHLLHDHLGLQSGPVGHSVMSTDHAALDDIMLSVPSHESGQDVEMRDEEQLSDNKPYTKPSDYSGEQDDTNKRTDEERRSTPTEEPPEMSRSRKCCWRGCERSFSGVDDLMNHLTAEHVGSGKNHYECFWGGCERNGEKGFSSKQKVCRHLQTHTGHKPFQCKLCEQHFSEAATLQQHMRRHTQEKPYPCDHPGCGKAFAIAGALTIHRRTHVGEKPFKCKYCERAFSESSNLSKHLRTHTGVRPYVCEEPGCGKSFSRPDQFTRHQRVHAKRSRAASPGNNNAEILRSSVIPRGTFDLGC